MMGCQVTTKTQEIAYSRGAWLVADMCCPWFDRERDTDSDGWYQDRIDESSLSAASHELPETLQEYLLWRQRKGLGSQAYEWDEEDYATALEFVRTAAERGEYASLSH